MRSSKSRSRSKQNNRPRTLGNIVNRVFDSSGPEGKVRGTPQQIIEKYQLLARDAQLSNDRVAAEAFLQHAEHYTRMLAEAQREMAAEQEARQQQYQQNGGHNGNHGGGQNGGQNGGHNGNQNVGYQNNNRDRDRDGNRDGNRDNNRNWRDDRPADYGNGDQPDLVAEASAPVQSDVQADDRAPAYDDRAPVYDLRDEGQAQPESMLVETPETRAPREDRRDSTRAPAASKPKPPRDNSAREDGGNRSNGDKPQKPRAPKKPKEEAATLPLDMPVAEGDA